MNVVPKERASKSRSEYEQTNIKQAKICTKQSTKTICVTVTERIPIQKEFSAGFYSAVLYGAKVLPDRLSLAELVTWSQTRPTSWHYL